MLISVVDHLEHQLKSGRLDLEAATSLVMAQAKPRPELEGVRVTDRRGLVIVGKGLQERGPVDLGNRDWFVWQRDNPGGGLFMSQALRSRFNQQWIVSFSRAYRDPQGAFAGTVTAAVPLSYFQQALQTLDVGQKGFVELRDRQLSLVAAHTPQPRAATEEPAGRPVGAELRQAVQGGAAKGTVLTGDGFTVSFERVPQVPLLVMVGLHSDEYMANWRTNASAFGLGSGVILLLYGAVLGWAWRSRLQTREARQRMHRLAQVFERTGESIALFNADYRVLEVNPAFEALTGYRADEVRGRSAEFLRAPGSSGSAHNTM